MRQELDQQLNQSDSEALDPREKIWEMATKLGVKLNAEERDQAPKVLLKVIVKMTCPHLSMIKL